MRLVPITALSLALLLPSLAEAKGGDISKGVDLTDFADLEVLAERVERDAFKSLVLKAFVPKRPKGLVYDRYAGFQERWKEAYIEIARQVTNDLATLCGVDVSDRTEKLKKRWNRLKNAAKKETNSKKKRKNNPQAAEGFMVLKASLPRINQLIEMHFGKPDPKQDERRATATERIMKRFHVGKQRAKFDIKSCNEVSVRLVESGLELVRSEVKSWRFKPLLDADGAPVTLGGLKVMHANKMRTGNVRYTMRALSHLEYYRITIQLVGKISAGGQVSGYSQDKLEVVGARLLFGFYYFLRYGDQLVVIKEPKPLSKPLK